MAKVIATQPGYFGAVLRAAGEPFEIPDEIMDDEKRRPSWVRLARKGSPEIAAPETAGGAQPTASAQAPGAPEPQGNGVAEVLGTAPDWVAPGAAAPAAPKAQAAAPVAK